MVGARKEEETSPEAVVVRKKRWRTKARMEAMVVAETKYRLHLPPCLCDPVGHRTYRRPHHFAAHVRHVRLVSTGDVESD